MHGLGIILFDDPVLAENSEVESWFCVYLLEFNKCPVFESIKTS